MTQRSDPSSRTDRPLLRGSHSEIEPFLRGILASGVLLLLAIAFEHLFFDQGFYASLVLHPFWIIVLLATLESGLYVGVATAGLAALLMEWPPRQVGVDITDYFVDLAMLPLQWLLAALCIGLFVQANIRALAALRRENARLMDMNETLASEIMRADQALHETEVRIVTQPHNPAPPLAAFADLAGLEQAPAASVASQTRAVALCFTPLPCDLLLISEDGRRAWPQDPRTSPIFSGPVPLPVQVLERLHDFAPAFVIPADSLGHPGGHLVLAAIRGRTAGALTGAVAFLTTDATGTEGLCALADLLARALAGPMSDAPALRLTEDQSVPA